MYRQSVRIICPRCAFSAAVGVTAAVLVVLSLIHNVSALAHLGGAVVPEVRPSHLSKVSSLVSSALGDAPNPAYSDEDSDTENNSSDRYAGARKAVADSSISNVTPQHELVYGELSVPVLSKILDAVGVQEGDVFLDIGSGDGALAMGASLLYANLPSSADGQRTGMSKNPIRKAIGVEIVPGLVDRSKVHAENLNTLLHTAVEGDDTDNMLGKNQAEMDFLLGDVHEVDTDIRMSAVLAATTLAVCFATTWSAGNVGTSTKGCTSLQGRKLPKLSKALAAGLGRDARVVIIDGKLLGSDGFSWQGDLKIFCPDTAPYSIARLYTKL